jgi:hypothetical protein
LRGDNSGAQARGVPTVPLEEILNDIKMSKKEMRTAWSLDGLRSPHASQSVQRRLCCSWVAFLPVHPSESSVLISNACRRSVHIDHNTIPSIIYTHPEVAWVGKTEEQACAYAFKITPLKALKQPQMHHNRPHHQIGNLVRLLRD